MSEFTPIPLTLKPGLLKGRSVQASRDRYVDSNMVRYWNGYAQRWDGWDLFNENSLGNPARGHLAWIALDGTPLMAWGTADKLWLWRAGVLHDITPVGLAAGFVDTQAETGWGEGGWGEGGWGGAYPIGEENGGRARTWMLAKWGQDLVANPRGGGIYHWAFESGTPSPAVILADAPPSCLGIFVTDDRHLVALGASYGPDPEDQSPLRIAWPNRETLDEWTPLPDNTAGDMLLEAGNEIIGWRSTRSGYVIMTDASLHTMTLVGGNDVFGIDRKGSAAGLVAPHAIVEADGVAAWMGEDGFYTYDAVIRPMPCDVHDDIFKNINRRQIFKVCAGTNVAFGEAIWFYPRGDNVECSHFVAVNKEGWSQGELARTTWMDQSPVVRTPIATTPEGAIIEHDVGDVDENGDEIEYSLTTGDLSLNLGAVVAGGENYTRLRNVVPDYEYIEGDHSLTIEARRRPMDTHSMTKGPYEFDSSTGHFTVKARGRSVRMTLAGNGKFRMGEMIAYGKPDGGR